MHLIVDTVADPPSPVSLNYNATSDGRSRSFKPFVSLGKGRRPIGEQAFVAGGVLAQVQDRISIWRGPF
jgi:hypothetical protein